MRTYRDFFDIFDEFERFFDVFDKRFTKSLPVKSNFDLTNYRMPVVDQWETENELITTIELPGVDKKDIDLNIDENLITIKVEQNNELKKKGKNNFEIQRSYQGFYREILLPDYVDADKAKATYKNGILEIRIPKVKKTTKGRKLKIE